MNEIKETESWAYKEVIKDGFNHAREAINNSYNGCTKKSVKEYIYSFKCLCFENGELSHITTIDTKEFYNLTESVGRRKSLENPEDNFFHMLSFLPKASSLDHPKLNEKTAYWEFEKIYLDIYKYGSKCKSIRINLIDDDLTEFFNTCHVNNCRFQFLKKISYKRFIVLFIDFMIFFYKRFLLDKNSKISKKITKIIENTNDNDKDLTFYFLENRSLNKLCKKQFKKFLIKQDNNIKELLE